MTTIGKIAPFVKLLGGAIVIPTLFLAAFTTSSEVLRTPQLASPTSKSTIGGGLGVVREYYRYNVDSINNVPEVKAPKNKGATQKKKIFTLLTVGENSGLEVHTLKSGTRK